MHSQCSHIITMKFFILAGLLVIVVNAEKYAAQFKSFILEYGKIYMDQIEETKRFAIFRDHLRSIEKHNALYEEGEVYYKQAVNRFSDMTPEEFKASLKIRPDPSAKSSNRMYVQKRVSVTESVDWRTAGQVSNVKRQDYCGSCWAFAISGTVEGAYYRKTGRLVTFSAQQMIDCATKDGCSGAYFQQAFSYVLENGLESDRSYPYVDYNGICKYNPYAVVAKVSSYTTLSGSEIDLLEAVATVGPVAATMDASLLAYYSSGIFYTPYCRQEHGNHAVLVVGYGVENNHAYWIIKNSWGPYWGENGYFRMIRNQNLCGIADDAVFATID